VKKNPAKAGLEGAKHIWKYIETYIEAGGAKASPAFSSPLE